MIQHVCKGCKGDAGWHPPQGHPRLWVLLAVVEFPIHVLARLGGPWCQERHLKLRPGADAQASLVKQLARLCAGELQT